jgi:septal ring factor EnvC (AmiA/AmiB activator)
LIVRRIAAAIALSFCVFFPFCAPASDTPAAHLDGLRERLERLRGALAQSEGDREEAREELRSSERAISAANRELRELARKRQAALSAHAELESDKRQLEAAVAEREQALGRLLVALYRSGQPGLARLLVSGQDPNQTARELRYLAYVSRAQAGLVESLRPELARLREAQARLLEGSAGIASIEAGQRTARDELLRQQAARRATLARVSQRIRAQSREVKLLQRDQARLARLVQEIARATAASAPPVRSERVPQPQASPGLLAGVKGRLRLPVRGVVTNRFGSARAGGGPSWKGLFIRSAQGEEVHAVAEGRVVFADWMRGYGNLVILDHGGGYLTVYGNNESLLKEVGDRVDAAEAIATVGASGGGQETGVYFEVRHEGKAFDPLLWAKLR